MLPVVTAVAVSNTPSSNIILQASAVVPRRKNPCMREKYPTSPPNACDTARGLRRNPAKARVVAYDAACGVLKALPRRALVLPQRGSRGVAV